MMQRGCRRRDDRHHVLQRQLLVALGEPGQQRAQVDAVHVLHREVRLAPVLADVVDLDDVVVVEHRGEARLVDERLHALGVAREFRAQPLDGDVALEPLDPACAPDQQIRERTLGERLEDVVATEPVARHFPVVTRLVSP